MDVKPAESEIDDRRPDPSPVRGARYGRPIGQGRSRSSKLRRLFVSLMALAFLAGPMLAQAVEACASCCCAAMDSDMTERSHHEGCSGSIDTADCCDVEAASTPLPADRLASTVEFHDRAIVAARYPVPRLDEAQACFGRNRPAAQLAHRVSPLRRSVVLRL